MEVSSPQVVGQHVKVPKISIQDQIVPAPQVLEANDEAGVKEIPEGFM